jgi:hypothetical protein
MIRLKLLNSARKINRKKTLILFVFLFILSAGLAFGQIAGSHIVSGLLQGRRFVLLFYSPPFEYLRTASLLYSSEELKRLEGYYSLLDNKIIDNDLLFERYKQESEFIKPVIVWLLGYSGEKDSVLKFISGEYANADQRVKKEILRTMKRLDKAYFNNFVPLHKIKIKDE